MGVLSRIKAYIFGVPAPVLNPDETLVIEVLGPIGGDLPDEWRALKFSAIDQGLNIGRDRVRDACRSLAAKGFAAFEPQTWTEDGEFYGAGYRATLAGRRLAIDTQPGETL